MGLNDHCPGFDSYVSTLRDGKGCPRYPDHLQLLASITGQDHWHLPGTQQHWQAIVDRILKGTIFHNPPPPRVGVGIIGSLEFNAFAGRDDLTQWYFIGMVYFAQVRLHLVWHRLMNQPGAMSSVGDATKEVDQQLKKIDILKLGIDLDNLQGPDDLQPKFGLPATGKTRVAFAHFASILGMQFLSLHELSHIMCGHVGHLGRAAADDGFFAEDSLKLSRGPDLSSEVVEYQADDYAVTHMITSCLIRLTTNEPESAPEAQFVRDLDTTVFTVTSSVYLVFRVFYQLRGSVRPNLDHLATGGAPAPDRAGGCYDLPDRRGGDTDAPTSGKGQTGCRQ